MAGSMKEQALLIVGIALGPVLFSVSSSYADLPRIGPLGYFTWGYPLSWRIAAHATPGGIAWGDFFLDVLFWASPSMAIVEGSSPVGIPYLA